MIMNCRLRLKATKIKSQRKTLRRLRISSCLGKKTVDTGVLQTTKMITLKSCNLSEYKVEHHINKGEGKGEVNSDQHLSDEYFPN